MADHAVVIGIENYPGLNNLAGPCNDAENFINWLSNAQGGGLDSRHIVSKLSRDYPPPHNVYDAHPALNDLEALFRPLVVKAANGQHTEGRLFIFLAGHGFADSQDANSAALFTANAEFLYPLHLAVLDYANFFKRTWAFDEIIVIMDACRSTNPLQEISRAQLPRVSPHPNSNKVKMFIGLATGFNQVARERDVGGTVRGIFTMALLDALDNAPANRMGRVNGTAIKRHIHNTIDHFAGDLQVSPPEIDADEDKDVLFLKRRTSGIATHFHFGPEHYQQTLIIKFGGVNEVHRSTIQSSPVSVPLQPGLYKAQLAESQSAKNFEVPNDADVRF